MTSAPCSSALPRNTTHTTNNTRRRWLQQAGLLGASALLPCTSALAQPGKPAGKNLVVAQIVDMSLAQQDVSRDFLTGSRTAWQDINARGGIRGRPVQHLSIEADGNADSLRGALDGIRDNPACVALSGTVGDQLAGQLTALLGKDKTGIAHVAPWLQNSSVQFDDRTFPIFAARQEQIAHALKNLSVMGLKDIGAIYATPQDQQANHLDVERIAGEMQLKLLAFAGNGDLRRLGQKLTPQTPAVLLFLGGTPELAEFTQGLAKQARQRYVVALADVNLQTMLQMGAARSTPVIATQPVPLVNSSLPVVRSYRETLSRLADEAPTPLSLAGFIAARYTFEVLNDLDGAITRQSALTAFQRRASTDIGGFRIAYNAQHRGSNYVTQSMMTVDGRVIG